MNSENALYLFKTSFFYYSVILFTYKGLCMKNMIKILSIIGALLSSVAGYAKPSNDLSGLWEETILSGDYGDAENDLFYISNFRH